MLPCSVNASRRCLVRVRSCMERYQQLAVAAAVALFLRTSGRHAFGFGQLPPVHLYWWMGSRSACKKRFLSSLQCIREMSWRLGQCYDTSYGCSKSLTFGHIPRVEFSDDMSRSRRLSMNQTLLLVLSQLRPCVLCVYRSEQPISFIIPPRLALVRL